MKQHSSRDKATPMNRRTTRWETFLNAMDAIIPWTDWVRLIEPHCHMGSPGLSPVGIEPMLRMYLCKAGLTSPMRPSKTTSSTAGP